MDDALDFLEGRVPIFNPADLPEGLGRAEVTLIESFTCADDAASVPLEMALQAAENVKSLIVMQYHLGMPAPEPLETSASQAAMKRCGVERAPALLVNGKRVDPEPVALLDAKQILEGVAAIPSPDTPRLLKIEAAALPAEERSWQIRVSADQLKDAGRCEIVLVERRCMLFSSTGIGMFRNVVRACLYDQTLSSPQEPVTTTFYLNQVQADVAAYTDAVQKTNNFKFLMVSSYIDANMTFAAVKLYAPDGRLIAAGSQELTTAGDNNGK